MLEWWLLGLHKLLAFAGLCIVLPAVKHVGPFAFTVPAARGTVNAVILVRERVFKSAVAGCAGGYLRAVVRTWCSLQSIV